MPVKKKHSSLVTSQSIIIFAVILCSLFLIPSVLLFIKAHPKPIYRYDPHMYTQLENTPNVLESFFLPVTSLFSQRQQITVSLGQEEDVPLEDLKYVPDGHISKIQQTDGTISLFVTALNKTYLLQGKSLSTLQLVTDRNMIPIPILQPLGNDFESSYAGFGSVVVDSDNNTLLGFYHAEKRINPDASDSQLATIAMAESIDGGRNWERQGKIVTGMQELPVGTKTSGAGSPSVIIIGNYLYIYYVDWDDTYPTSIHLARSPLSSHGMPGTWQKYNNGAFTEDGIGGKSTPIISPPTINEQTTVYISNPSISYNTYFQKYLGIFETNLGFYAALSEDGISWHSFTQIFVFPKDTNIPKTIGDIWYSYPTYFSDGTPTDMITGQSGYLYYSRGIFGQYHTMVRRKIIFK